MNEQIIEKLTAIANDHSCGVIETLETRMSDGLDFHEVSVWGLKRMLIEAFELGQASK